MVLGLKRGWLDTERLHGKYGIDPLAAWAPVWVGLEAEGFLDQLRPRPHLSRKGLLTVDALLHRFFEAERLAAAS